MDPEAPNLLKQAWQIYFEEATAIQTTNDDEKRPIKANLDTKGNGRGTERPTKHMDTKAG